MIQAINAKSDQTGVRANWLGETGLVLSNASGHEGKNIELGLSGGATGLTALGLVTGFMRVVMRSLQRVSRLSPILFLQQRNR